MCRPAWIIAGMIVVCVISFVLVELPIEDILKQDVAWETVTAIILKTLGWCGILFSALFGLFLFSSLVRGLSWQHAILVFYLLLIITTLMFPDAQVVVLAIVESIKEFGKS